jgi:hypothetical protein
MIDSPRIQQLRELIQRHARAIEELTAERDDLQAALARELEEERLLTEAKDREKLIAFGFRAILQIESGLSHSEVAKINSCSRVYLNEAVAAWRRYEGLVRTRKPPAPQPAEEVR